MILTEFEGKKKQHSHSLNSLLNSLLGTRAETGVCNYSLGRSIMEEKEPEAEENGFRTGTV